MEGNLEVIKCTGDHYSMMEPARAPEIGSKIVTAGLLRFRRLLPNAARLPTNNCQNFALKTFKEGIQVHLSIKRGMSVFDGHSFI